MSELELLKSKIERGFEKYGLGDHKFQIAAKAETSYEVVRQWFRIPLRKNQKVEMAALELLEVTREAYESKIQSL